jgi:predicted O-methyltransferase YrrM
MGAFCAAVKHWDSEMPEQIRKLLAIGNYAARSPRCFFRAARDACSLLLDRNFSEASYLPNMSAPLLDQLAKYDVKLPPVSAIMDGTQDLHGLVFLVSLARACGACSMFEIGTFTGLTALTIAMNCPDAVVHTLDLPQAAQPMLKIDQSDAKYVPSMRRIRVYEGRPESARIVQHEGDSARFDFNALGRKFDLVYVDGSHSYDYVANDTHAAFSIASSSGVIVWDDYQRLWPDVVRYLNERVDLKLHRVPGTRLVVWFGDSYQAFAGSRTKK